MYLKIDTEKKIITITHKTSLMDLLTFINNMNLDIKEWDIDVEKEIQIQTITVDKPNWTNPNLPYITPTPYNNPIKNPWELPGITYPGWQPDYYRVTCLIN